MNEYGNAKNDKEAIEELADKLEVMHSLSEYHGSNIEKGMKFGKRKRKKGIASKIK
jgi:predicted house-cleaning noncanonical NTP pyrophosphatase (MazG superfamily)